MSAAAQNISWPPFLSATYGQSKPVGELQKDGRGGRCTGHFSLSKFYRLLPNTCRFDMKTVRFQSILSLHTGFNDNFTFILKYIIENSNALIFTKPWYSAILFAAVCGDISSVAINLNAVYYGFFLQISMATRRGWHRAGGGGRGDKQDYIGAGLYFLQNTNISVLSVSSLNSRN